MEIGTIFTLDQYEEAYAYAVANNCNIEEIEQKDGVRRYQIVEIPQPTVEERNEAIRATREDLYIKTVDVLHAQRQKDIIMGEWSEEKESEYIAKVKERVAKIKEENPYVE